MKISFFLKSILLFACTSFQAYSQDYFNKFVSLSHIIQNIDNADQYNFNSVLSVKEIAEIEKQLKGQFMDKGTFVLAYSSEHEEEAFIMELKDSKNSISITSKNVILSDGKENKVEPYNGSILSYSFTRDNYGKKNNGVFINKDFIGNENKVLEFLYIQDVINVNDREKIHTYLSLKYGISLQDSYYISSLNDTIWSPKENKGFEYRVTGIGKDEGYGLYQKKSGNSESKEFIISLNGTESINNNSFLVWSDNGKSTFLKTDSSNKEIGTIDRLWKLNLLGVKEDFRDTSITVDPNMLFEKYNNRLEETDDVLWLIMSNTPDLGSDAVYIRQNRKEKGKVVFDNIDFTDTRYFSFLIAPEFFINYELDTVLCADHIDISIEIIGGVVPYFMEINGNNYQYTEQLKESHYILSGLNSGSYNVVIKDRFENSFVFQLDIPEKERVNVTMKELWVLSDNTETSIIPQISDIDNVVGYEWSKNEEVISNKSFLKTNETGEYLLKVYTTTGCEKEISFKVVSPDITSEQISVYPNSSERGQPFYVDFKLPEQNNVEILIYDISGKELYRENLQAIQNYKYSNTIQTSGTYLIVITTEEASLVKKIVIK